MKLSSSSVKAILGDSKEVLVYGFSNCQYGYVARALNALQIKAMIKDSFKNEFEMLAFDSESHALDAIQDLNSNEYQEYMEREKTILFARECKTLITSLCVNNLKRKQNNEPIIPLLFCVEAEFPGYSVSLNIKSVAESHPMLGTYITDEELRRSFKMSTFETNPEFKAVIKETIKFVKLLPDSFEPDSYHLQSIAPFWEKPEWPSAWDKRQPMKTPAALKTKQFPWREVTSQKVSAILQNQGLFKESGAEDAEDQRAPADNPASSAGMASIA
ncbi:hypothetical protein A8135_11775 [Legionella jamestowniensis]|uniref:Dot/Icm T4SS effector n=1 Tax=Legionella jamestowniensis TaxID=455 RepID=A0ABX2XZ74_9GAMM|nr:hypothetical protein [Legionella jamestowniensis]OCH98236.1 hypothetical protein A8135_11775 [Legionella jamestowniensis]